MRAVVGILSVLATTSRPNPQGTGTVDHSDFTPTLETLGAAGLAGVQGVRGQLDGYIARMTTVDPDRLARDHALAFWINFYNANAIDLALEAFALGRTSVLHLPKGFSRSIATIAEEDLSLDAIEHGKVRRFRDPRIHAALVCGSLSCPTLRRLPFTGEDVDHELEDQMRTFLNGGGAMAGGAGRVELSRLFKWYGADFVRPHRMPTLWPASRRTVLQATRRWLPDQLVDATEVGYQSYDWGLACSVR